MGGSEIILLVFRALFAVVGILMVYGTAKRWRPLVDPPLNGSNSQSIILRALGRRGLVIWNYAIGILFILFGVSSVISLFQT